MHRVYNQLLSVIFLSLFLLSACDNDGSGGNHAPIVLGDSSLIVTEKDNQYLQDHVTDIKTPEPKPNDTPAPPPAHDTIRPATTAVTNTAAQAQPVAVTTQPVAENVKGLNIAFSEVTVSIPGINAKSASRNQNLARANGVTYQLISGNLNGNKLVTSNGTVLKVSQRYQTMLMLKDEDGSLPLETLTNTTDWENMPGKGSYNIASLAPARLEAPDFTPTSLRKAIIAAARRHRISHKDEQEWITTVRNIRKAPHKPLMVTLRSVMWKIDGKNAKGKTFSKQVRIDMPAL